MKTLLLLAILTALTGMSPAKETRKIKLRTLCFQKVDGISEVLLVAGGKPSPTASIKLFTSTFSDEVEATIKGESIRFAIPAKGKDGNDTLRTVAVGKAVPGNRQLAVFIPGKGDTPYDLVILDDSEKAFPMGSILALNLSPTDVRIEVGERRMAIKPGGRKLRPAPTKLNDRNQANVIVSFKDRDGDWRTANNTRWVISPLTRSLLIAFIHPSTGQPTVNSYVETPPWRRPKLP